MATVLPILFLLAIVAALMTCAALFTPKGPNQVVIRTGIMLSLAACYLMWMVTYLAQLHPLLRALRGYLRLAHQLTRQ
ncbi:hypothetical protein HMN09_00040100 [Mycena chlorophos]|uniref:Uncharacterized protein n=1 Tax=Mycena chlorophos TaxID=658473 RepID=A0A8H6TTR4_MYCCL|nr:hypothetical protein HMN09_00040100 [Mycena chlorophos]